MEKINFLGSKFRTTLLFIILAELLSFFVLWLKIAIDLRLIFFLIIISIIFIVSLYNIKYGLFVAIVELFIGSQGHLFDLIVNNYLISIRLGIFFVVMFAWLIHIFKNNKLNSIKNIILQNRTLTILAIFCLWAFVFALIRNNLPENIFLDFNAWLYFFYIFPFLSILYKTKDLNSILQIFTASICALTIKTLLFLFIFSHKLNLFKDFYTWGRDTRWGEFTLMGDNFYRIFAQSHLFILIGCFIFLGFLLFKKDKVYQKSDNKLLSLLLIFCFATIIISMSRTFWLAAVLGAIFLTIFGLVKYKLTIKKFILSIFKVSVYFILSYFLIIIIINFPLSLSSNFVPASSMLSERVTLSGEAVSSRWSQLPALTKAIAQHPIIGSGWGTTITYQSQDPRILTIDNPTGNYTTYAFEWGYLDMILKFGLLGTFVYLIFIFNIFKKYYQLWQKNIDPEFRALLVGLSIGLFVLIIVHGFSPYLNHPLGIGYILILLTILQLAKSHTPSLVPIKS